MYKIIADTHTHTVACDHAYSTLSENAGAAREKGLDAIVMTEHGPAMPGASTWMHFSNFDIIPREICGVAIIKGAEVNIMDYDGALDLDAAMLARMEWVIASMHTPTLLPGTREQHTNAWLKITENPLVDVLGHTGDGRYEFFHEPVLKAVKETGKVIEINSHSFRVRKGSGVNCRDIALLCEKLEIPVVVSSDAHYADTIGDFELALQMLSEISFPERLILNADKDRFFAAVEARKAYRLGAVT